MKQKKKQNRKKKKGTQRRALNYDGILTGKYSIRDEKPDKKAANREWFSRRKGKSQKEGD